MATPTGHRTRHPEMIVISDDEYDEDEDVEHRPQSSSAQYTDHRQDATSRNVRGEPPVGEARSAIALDCYDNDASDGNGDGGGGGGVYHLDDLRVRYRNCMAGNAAAEPWPYAMAADEPRGPLYDFDDHHTREPVGPRHDVALLPHLNKNRASSISVEAAADAILTVDDILQRVLAIFPDVSHEYVCKLYQGFDDNGEFQVLSADFRFESIIEGLVSDEAYPKQDKGKQPQLKRKRQDSNDEADRQRWEGPNRLRTPSGLTTAMGDMLKAEFPEFARKDINQLLGECRHFYQTYLRLAEAKDTAHPTYGRGRSAQGSSVSAEDIADGKRIQHPTLLEELHAARKRADQLRIERAQKIAKDKAEQENMQRAITAGETADCMACMDHLPLNRQIRCDGDEAHFTCFECAQTYLGVLVGDAKCDMRCPSGCGAGFTHSQLALLSDQDLVTKLAHLQQEKDIRDAAMNDIGECPFCDFKGIVPPIEVDFEFRCENPECEKVSCRRCNNISHIPQSCQEYANDHKLNSRHTVEEAMTAALVRKCNNCQKPFIKDTGCNKMRCPSCGNMQCYVCSASVSNYDHFVDRPSGTRGGQGGKSSGKCVLYDDVEERHEREVREAEVTARAEVISANPAVAEEDLQINVSEAVKSATTARAGRVNERIPVFGVAPPPAVLGREFFGPNRYANVGHPFIGHANAMLRHDAPFYDLMQAHAQHLNLRRRQLHGLDQPGPPAALQMEPVPPPVFNDQPPNINRPMGLAHHMRRLHDPRNRPLPPYDLPHPPVIPGPLPQNYPFMLRPGPAANHDTNAFFARGAQPGFYGFIPPTIG